MLTPLLLLLAVQQPQPGGFWHAGEVVRGEGRQYGQFGNRLAFLGDLDSDGCDDWISSSISSFNGAVVRVISGRTGDEIWRVTGAEVGTVSTYFGYGVAAAGDLDVDGVPDFLIGVPNYDYPDQRGVVLALSGRTKQVIQTFKAPDYSFWLGAHGLAGAHDFTGDGVPDLVASDYQFSSSRGVLYLFDGATGQVVWRRLGTYSGENTGQELAIIGDSDGDPAAEVISYSGAYPHSYGGVDVLDGASGVLEGRVNGTGFLGASSLCGAGDVDGDGLADFAAIDIYPPRVLVFRGKDTALLHEFIYESSRNRLFAVSGGMDLDQDGGPDLVVGSPFTRNERGGVGKVFVQSIRDGRLIAALGWSAEALAFGVQVVAGGDLTGDGRPDVLAADTEIPRAQQVAVGVVVPWAYEPYLTASHRSISAAQGAQVSFEIDFPSQDAGNAYRLLASPAGAAGYASLGGWSIPLGDSLLLHRMWFNPPAAFDHPAGTLDPSGDATVLLTLPPGAASHAVGKTLAFAAITGIAPRQPSRCSGPVFLTILP